VISDSIAFTGFYELVLSRHLLTLARKGGTMVDVGAHVGYFTLLWAAANRANRCFAFEPSPRNIERLKRNVARNGFDAVIEVQPKAASREHASLPFDVGPPEQTGWGGIVATPGSGTILVEAVRVDEVGSNLNEIAFLKIDAEGADTWVLMGCERLLRGRRVKSVWFEQNKPRMRALGIGEEEARDYLLSVGYLASPLSNPSADIVQWSATPA
jgi:FkbM family methyltransferase